MGIMEVPQKIKNNDLMIPHNLFVSVCRVPFLYQLWVWFQLIPFPFSFTTHHPHEPSFCVWILQAHLASLLFLWLEHLFLVHSMAGSMVPLRAWSNYHLLHWPQINGLSIHFQSPGPFKFSVWHNICSWHVYLFVQLHGFSVSPTGS
jgi:hypothetical protein